MKVQNFLNNLKINKASYLFFLIFPALISGPFLPDLIISIIAVTFLYISVTKKNIESFKSSYFLFFLLFYFFVIISSVLSDNIYGSLKNSSTLIRFGLYSLAISWIIKRDEKLIINNFYLIAILIISFLFLDSMTQYFFGSNIFGLKLPEDVQQFNRISSVFGDELILGSYISRMIPIFIFFMIEKKINKNLILFILLLSNLIVLISGERTAVGFIAIFDVLFLFKFTNTKREKLYVCFFYIILILFLSLNTKVSNRIISYTILQISGDVKKISQSQNQEINNKKLESKDRIFPKYIFSEQHTQHYILAYEIFKDNLLIGVGPKNFRNNCNNFEYSNLKAGCSTHPHNLVMQFASETGLIGLSFYFLTLIFIIKKIFSLMKKKLSQDAHYMGKYVLYLGLFINLFPFFPSGNFFNNWLCSIFFTIVGLTVYKEQMVKKNEKYFPQI